MNSKKTITSLRTAKSPLKFINLGIGAGVAAGSAALGSEKGRNIARKILDPAGIFGTDTKDHGLEQAEADMED